MAGSNKICKPGQMLFKAGEASDGMYIVRKGELRIYLEQDGKEVTLATVGDGGMIGEMALFDRQPRSASVRALKDSEVTHISNVDFEKLMKQIPKWFVGLMATLSGRLRQTNERLQKVEAGASSKGKPFSVAIRLLNLGDLLWTKYGEKENKETIVQKDVLTQNMVELFGEDPEKVRLFFEILVKEGVMTQKQDSYKKAAFGLTNRSFFTTYCTFVTDFVKGNPTLRCLPEPSQELLAIVADMTEKSPYESSTITFEELQETGKRQALETMHWRKTMEAFKATGDSCKLVKTSTPSGMGLRTTKKEIRGFIRNHKILAGLHRGNLS